MGYNDYQNLIVGQISLEDSSQPVYWNTQISEWQVLDEDSYETVNYVTCVDTTNLYPDQNIEGNNFVKLNPTFDKLGDQLRTEFALQKIENNLYRGFKKWELKFWKHPGVYTEYDLNTLPREVTLTTLVDWDILADETHGTGIGTRHNAEDEHGNLIPGNYIEEIFNELDDEIDQNYYTAHLSTEIFVRYGFSIQGEFTADNMGYLYINGTEIVTATYDPPVEYNYSFTAGWYKIDIVWNEATIGDGMKLGFDITDIFNRLSND